jgi:Mitochondrial carrier protein
VRTRLRQAPSLTGQQQLKYNGLIRCSITVFREEGMMAFYGGLTPHLMRSVPAAMIYFTAYEGILAWAGIET